MVFFLIIYRYHQYSYSGYKYTPLLSRAVRLAGHRLIVQYLFCVHTRQYC